MLQFSELLYHILCTVKRFFEVFAGLAQLYDIASTNLVPENAVVLINLSSRP